ncbi:uncharacterized protein LOC109851384 [Asparagus officinalis]|uniref:uncharacterized protein LOC109851384 n=1 Tax=Asparagus officinalis TaxID=4686 RepID=UPI00098DFA52|nr:uncharacterized protein LOC109851384 [Asparagus officinalis]XP_020277059.1 uncharacterized protein LOC109851384 [Asparagus officinalis]
MATKGNLERVQRGLRTLFFMLTMVVSLLTISAPVLVAMGDVSVSLVLASRFACGRCYGLKEHVIRYGFRRSLMDIPLVSIIRSFIITCVYSLCDGPGLSHGPYLGTVTVSSIASIAILAVKACLFTPIVDIESEASPGLEKLHLKKSWGMSVLFLSSVVFAFGHIVVAYRTSCRARRKLLIHRIDPESVLCYKTVFSGYTKLPRSPTPYSGRSARSDSETKRKAPVHDEEELPVSLLADADSMFIACQGLTVHYKQTSPESLSSRSLASLPFHGSNLTCSPPSISPARLEGSLMHQSKTFYQYNRSFSCQFQNSSLYAPLLQDSSVSSSFLSDEIPVLNLDEVKSDGCIFEPLTVSTNVVENAKFAVVLVHGFGGGVFSWRHVMGVLARQVGCPVVAFDRPGWGLTSRLRRKDWEDRQMPNPYTLESQVDLLISFCLSMGFTSVVFVGHDDGGLLALKTAEKLRASSETILIEVKGVVLLSVSLSREVIPAFARILLHTTLGKKHVVRPLLRTEITQVINRRAWYNSTKLTVEVLNLYKAPLCVEGWEEALHEIGRLSCELVLSPQNAAALLKSVEDVPILVIAGAEDALVPLKSTQAMASKLVNSRLVAISGCGHLPHEECPKALLAALQPFITRLLQSPAPEASQTQ